ncbi:MAG TPA: ATP-grasp domain-containing protein [Anaerolineae bacterium]
MNIGVIYNLTGEVLKGTPQDRLADLEAIEVAAAVAAALAANGHRATTVNICEAGFAELGAFDAIFNLTETVLGSDLPGAAIADRLEAMGVVYTGADGAALAHCEDKARAKAILSGHGLPTPRYQLIAGGDRVETTLNFPLIVKPVHEDGSIGIGDDAVVQDAGALARKVAEVLQVYRQPALIEEYIDGREFSAAVIGNGDDLQIFPLGEILFANPPGAPRIVSFDAKWVPGSPAWEATQVGCPADLDPEIEAQIRAMAAQVCQVLGCRDYARVDFRLHDRSLYVLEANPSPSLNPHGAGFISSAAAAGYSYAAVVNTILEAAIARQPVVVRPIDVFASIPPGQDRFILGQVGVQ